MAVVSMARIAAARAVPRAEGLDAPPARPTGSDLLNTIGAYIPTDVTALYVPVAAGMVAAESSAGTKRNVAIGVALLAAFAAWVLAHQAAVKAAEGATQPKPKAFTTARAGWYEILAAGVALFLWALAMPGSWHDFGKGELFVPALIVGVASIVIGGGARLLNR